LNGDVLRPLHPALGRGPPDAGLRGQGLCRALAPAAAAAAQRGGGRGRPRHPGRASSRGDAPRRTAQTTAQSRPVTDQKSALPQQRMSRQTRGTTNTINNTTPKENTAMAHMIENMLYVGAAPWHRLGIALDNPPTVAEAIRLAGLD